MPRTEVYEKLLNVGTLAEMVKILQLRVKTLKSVLRTSKPNDLDNLVSVSYQMGSGCLELYSALSRRQMPSVASSYSIDYSM